jgi:dipeptidase D
MTVEKISNKSDSGAYVSLIVVPRNQSWSARSDLFLKIAGVALVTAAAFTESSAPGTSGDVSAPVNIAQASYKNEGWNMAAAPVQFEPKTVCEYFMGILQRPHPSATQRDVTANEDPVRRYVVEQARNIPGVEVAFYKPDAKKPGDRVIVLRRPGAGKYARKAPVILQAHLDMVYNPLTMEFPLTPFLDSSRSDGTWIKARDRNDRPCTLGADDGIGVATALALLGDAGLRDYPVECLFTVQEETDMEGAKKCDLGNLTGTTLINLDAEELSQIIFGSAGGAETNFGADITRLDDASDYVNLKVSVSGLRGGHSGIDINKGRLNAIKVLGQVLMRLDKRLNAPDSARGIRRYDIRVCDFRRTDVLKANAIPAGAEAVVAVPREQVDNFKMDFTACCEATKAQCRPVENRCAFLIEAAHVPLRMLDCRSTDALLCIIAQIPAGAISMIPEVPEVVETSSNLYNVAVINNHAVVEASNRSSSESALKALNALQISIGKIYNFKVKTGINRYLSWQPDHNSRVLKVASDVYRKLYGDDAKATVIHAGLECSTLSSRFNTEKNRKLDCISIGPTVENPHSCDETLEIESRDGKRPVRQFYDCVCEIVRALYE